MPLAEPEFGAMVYALPALLPLLLYLGVTVLFLGRRFSWSGRLGLPGAMILGAAGLVAWAITGTLVLSLFNALSPGPVVAWWLIGTALAWIQGWRHVRLLRFGIQPALRALRGVSWDGGLAVAIVAGLLLCAVAMGVLSPPNNADSFKYHLPRQLFWISHQTVFLTSAPFEHMLRQPPLAEYLGVNLMLLSGGDRLNNLVQLGALLHAVCLLGLILQRLGRPLREALYAAVFLVTLPAAFFEASNTKNDLVLTGTLLAVVWVIAGLERDGALRRDAAAALGFFAGCALLTKGTAVPFLAVIGVFALVVMRQRRVHIAPGVAGLALTIAVALPATHYLGQAKDIMHNESGTQSQHVNARFDPVTLLSVAVRNLAVEFATPSLALNRWLESGVSRLHAVLGRSIDDPLSTFQAQSFAVIYTPDQEDQPPAPVHFLCMVLLPFGIWRLRNASLRAQCLGLTGLYFAMMIAFSGLFRWQPWHARLLIPVVAIAALPAGIWLTSQAAAVRVGVLAALLLAWWPSLGVRTRPLLGRGSVLLQSEQNLLFGNMTEDGYVVESLGRTLAQMQLRTLRVDTEDASVYPILRALGIAAGSPIELLGPAERGSADVDAVLCFRHADSRVPFCGGTRQPGTNGMTLVREWAGWSLWARPQLVLGLEDPRLYPVFYGFSAAYGLGAPQGPYPRFRLPVFRYAEGDRTVVTIPPSLLRRTLYLELLPYQGSQAMAVQLGGQARTLCEFGTPERPGAELKISLEPARQAVDLVLTPVHPRSQATGPAEPFPIRVTRLQVLPEGTQPTGP